MIPAPVMALPSGALSVVTAADSKDGSGARLPGERPEGSIMSLKFWRLSSFLLFVLLFLFPFLVFPLPLCGENGYCNAPLEPIDVLPFAAPSGSSLLACLLRS